MVKAVLFDLDGTLLDIDMDVFLQYYFKAMAKMARVKGFGDPTQLIERVNRATWKMIGDSSGLKTNQERFMEDFLVDWPFSKQESEAFFDEFYVREFPLLKRWTQSFIGVKAMMEELFEQEVKVIIATQPVFPYLAIHHRMEWAGIADFPYTLITSYENMHYCKPYPAYYQEIAERIGVDPKDCLMVGNDTGEDLPAGKLGMKTFLLEDRIIDKGNSPYHPDARGKLPDLFQYIKAIR